MSRPIWDYPGPHRGDVDWWRKFTAFETARPDYYCFRPTVSYIPQGVTIDPRIGLPTLFRTPRVEVYDVVTTCGFLEEGGYSATFNQCKANFDVFRFDKDWSLDDVLLASLGGYQWIQILPDGGFVRWLRWPPMYGGIREKEVTWIAWRIEYPDGRIIDLAPEEWFNQTFNPYHAEINAARGRNATRHGDVLLDGSGRVTMHVQGDRVYPVFIPADIDFEDSRVLASGWPLPINSQWTSVEAFRFYREKNSFRDPGTGYYDTAYLKGVQAASLPREAILKLPASDVLGIYYGLGNWEESKSGRFVSATYKSVLFAETGHRAPVYAAYETLLRRRIYDARPDLHFIDLDGKKQVGLLPWFLFPPLDGIPCYKMAKNDLLTKFFSYASMALMAAFPAGLVSLAMTAGMTYAQFKDQQKMLTDFLKAQEVAAKAQEAAAKVIEESKVPSELEARAAGLPVGGGASGGSSALPLLLVAAAAAAFLA